MSKRKEFHLQVKRVAGINKAAGCKDCGGSYCITSCSLYASNACCGDDCSRFSEHPISCPTCAPWRELEKLCWYEPMCLTTDSKYGNGLYTPDEDCRCNASSEDGMCLYPNNPDTYTIQTIRAMLERLGEWEGFKVGLMTKVLLALNECILIENDEDHDWLTTCVMDLLIELTSSDVPMLKVAIEYLKGVDE